MQLYEYVTNCILQSQCVLLTLSKSDPPTIHVASDMMYGAFNSYQPGWRVSSQRLYAKYVYCAYYYTVYYVKSTIDLTIYARDLRDRL